jgi:hypothetical protein
MPAMLGSSFGLTDVSTDDLKKALALLHQGHLDTPVDAGVLARMGLQHCSAPLLSQLRGLDAPGVRAVLTAVLAERLTKR